MEWQITWICICYIRLLWWQQITGTGGGGSERNWQKGSTVGANADINDLEVNRLLQCQRFLTTENFSGRIWYRRFDQNHRYSENSAKWAQLYFPLGLPPLLWSMSLESHVKLPTSETPAMSTTAELQGWWWLSCLNRLLAESLFILFCFTMCGTPNVSQSPNYGSQRDETSIRSTVSMKRR